MRRAEQLFLMSANLQFQSCEMLKYYRLLFVCFVVVLFSNTHPEICVNRPETHIHCSVPGMRQCILVVSQQAWVSVWSICVYSYSLRDSENRMWAFSLFTPLLYNRPNSAVLISVYLVCQLRSEQHSDP